MIGRTLGHYRIVRKLGSGGMGDVYLAADTVLGRSIALKVLSSETGHVPDGPRRFIEEARAASGLNHPNIATIHELAESEGLRFNSHHAALRQAELLPTHNTHPRSFFACRLSAIQRHADYGDGRSVDSRRRVNRMRVVPNVTRLCKP